MVVRLIAPGKPTPPYPAAAFRHWYPRLLAAGATILLHPEMAHAKVLRIDGKVLIGGCNLDDLSLFRNDELDLQFEDPAVVESTEQAIFDDPAGDVDRRRRGGRPPRPDVERDDGPRLPLALGRRYDRLPRRVRRARPAVRAARAAAAAVAETSGDGTDAGPIAGGSAARSSTSRWRR